MGAIIATAIIAFASMFLPGFLIALALLRKTELHLFEIGVIGFIFGLIFPATLTWLESYAINYVHFFSFSLMLFEANVLILSAIGFILCIWQGAFKGFGSFLSTGQAEKRQHRPKQATWITWLVLLVIMMLTFSTRMISIGTAPKFFEFDPYFDMIDTNYILTYGKQLLLDPSAWPVVAAGTNHRVEPLIPYLEAYWYSLDNALGPHYAALNHTLMSYVGGVYPPVVAALLVFVIFMLLYREYGAHIGLIGAALTAGMPVLFSTFIAGEQLLEPWGIFSLFLFFAAYTFAVRDMKSVRLAIFAGIAFASTFLGAHYFTVDSGILIAYILFQGVIDVIRGRLSKDFYKMNVIIIVIIAIFFIAYEPYHSTLNTALPKVLGVPITVAWPVMALAFVAAIDYIPKILHKHSILFKQLELKHRLGFIILMLLLGLVAIGFTPLGKGVKSYLTLSTHFTTASTPLFMTVQEYIPTGFNYNYGANGLGILAAGISFSSNGQSFNIPLLALAIPFIAIILLSLSIVYRDNKTAIMYIAIAIPLLAAGFSEVKYMPHFGVAFIMLFCIMLGELIFFVENGYKFRGTVHELTEQQASTSHYARNHMTIYAILAIGLFFIYSLFAVVFVAAILALHWNTKGKGLLGFMLVVFISATALGALTGSGIIGEARSISQSFSAAALYASNPAGACSKLYSQGNSIGVNLLCNTVPTYWLNAMAWLSQNVGPHAPRVLSWWDYGDWINWFGHSNAVLRGDNAVPKEDYATAAGYVLGANDNYTPQRLAAIMNGNQTRYVLFDQDLIQKWQALNFLACIDTNQTTRAFAVAQGKSQNPPVPYVLGQSQCELSHDPQLVLVPYATLIGQVSQSGINNYCSISNSTTQFAASYLVVGSSLSNQSVCTDVTPTQNGVLKVYSTDGTKLNFYLSATQQPLGAVTVQGTQYLEFMAIYVPNANGTITNAPSQFYDSNFYKAFMLGSLPGFRLVYPLSNATGINYVNVTNPVRIYELVNYTGSLPAIPAKPSWIANNYSVP